MQNEIMLIFAPVAIYTVVCSSFEKVSGCSDEGWAFSRTFCFLETRNIIKGKILRIFFVEIQL